jgi:hypothetical protein
VLAPALTPENCEELIQAARHRIADEIRQLLADRRPRPDVAASIRPVPESSQQTWGSALPPPAASHAAPASPEPSAPPAAPPPPAPEKNRTEPLGAQRYRVQFMADRVTHAQLEELRALMRHQIPDGDLGRILARAVALLHAQVRKRKFAETSRPRSSHPAASPKEAPSRHIPAAMPRGLSKGRGAVLLRLVQRPALRGAGVSRVRSRRGLGVHASPLDRRNHLAMPRAQSTTSPDRLREPAHGALPAQQPAVSTGFKSSCLTVSRRAGGRPGNDLAGRLSAPR